MIKVEHMIEPAPKQMEFIIEGMRNPMNSWSKSDSVIRESAVSDGRIEKFYPGDNDKTLMQKLTAAGTDHRKFLRMMPLEVRVTAPLYWWKEFDTYKIGTVSNSCSTMHKIMSKELVIGDFSTDYLVAPSMNYLIAIICTLNTWRDIYNNMGDKSSIIVDGITMSKKDIWYQIIQLLPSSYNQTRNISMNYETFLNIYKSRKNHKLKEWRDFSKYILDHSEYSWLIELKKGEIV